MRQDRGGNAGLEVESEQDVKYRSQQSEVRYVKEIFLGT